MQRALGLDEDSAYTENAHLVSSHLRGPDKGLFFTNEDFDEVKGFFDSFSVSVCLGSGKKKKKKKGERNRN